ncbi:AP2/ERF and B3 domain-containing protein [Salix suchowensis]|nr:AP2/ERF and B3 domain-containing protein [Salix suchowensis]
MAPTCSKLLRETDIKERFSMPTGFLSYLPSLNGGHAVDFEAVDGSTGRVWPFRCSVRKKGRHPKPVISRGWRAFVNSKGLQVGDKVRLYKKINEAGANNHAYEIRAEKEIKIFGAPTDDRGEDAPSRQKKSEIRMAPRRRKTTTEVTAPSQTSEFLTCNRFTCPCLHRGLPAPPPHASVTGGGGSKRGFVGNDSSSFSCSNDTYWCA